MGDIADLLFTSFSLWMLPSMVLKKMVMGNFGGEKMMEPVVADSVDFMVERVYTYYYYSWMLKSMYKFILL